MSAQEKAPAKTGAGKHIMSYATQIVAACDRFALGLPRFAPDFERVAVLAALGVCHAL